MSSQLILVTQGDARFINRLFGAPLFLESLIRAWNTKGVLGKCDRAMAWSMILYYPLEHVWWLSTLKPKLVNVNSDKWSIWSCRFWTVYVLADLLQGVIRMRQTQKLAAEEKDEKKRNALKKQLRNQLIGYTVSFSDFPLALQWSDLSQNAPFTEWQIAATGIYGGVIGWLLKWIKANNY